MESCVYVAKRTSSLGCTPAGTVVFLLTANYKKTQTGLQENYPYLSKDVLSPG